MTGWLKLKLMGLITFINAAIIIHNLAGSLFQMVSFHSDLLLGDGNCDDLYT